MVNDINQKGIVRPEHRKEQWPGASNEAITFNDGGEVQVVNAPVIQ